jgi:hypothetical protein
MASCHVQLPVIGIRTTGVPRPVAWRMGWRTIDPDKHSAELEEAEVVLRLNCSETIHERLAVLTAEARRLRRAIAEVQRPAGTKRPTSFTRHMTQLRSNFMSG